MPNLTTKQCVKKVVWDCVHATGAYRLLRHWYGGVGSILSLHRVVRAAGHPRLSQNEELEITPEYLERVIQFLSKKKFEFVSLDALTQGLASGERARKRICFTFDDGYRDNLTEAYPIFRRHGIPFTIYVATDFPDRKILLWWYLLEQALEKRKAFVMTFREETHSFSDRNIAFAQLKRWILSASPAETVSILAEIGIDALEAARCTDQLALNWDEIRQAAGESLITIGAHSVSHRALGRLSDIEACAEITQSKAFLEARVGKSVAHFSYPYGSPDTCGRREFELAKAAGFRSATTTRLGNVFAEHAHLLHCLPRVPVVPNALQQLDDALTGFALVAAHRFRRVVGD